MKRKFTSLLLSGLMCLIGANAWALSQVNGVYQISTADELTVSLENDLEAQGINLFEHFGEYALTFGFRMSDADQQTIVECFM